MSGLPSVEGVAEIYELIAKEVSLEDEIAILHKTLSDGSARLKLAQEQYAAVTRSITDKMERMDVASHGNFGWQRRLAWFLAEFYRHNNRLPALRPE